MTQMFDVKSLGGKFLLDAHNSDQILSGAISFKFFHVCFNFCVNEDYGKQFCQSDLEFMERLSNFAMLSVIHCGLFIFWGKIK
jgi:hypothetical protein